MTLFLGILLLLQVLDSYTTATAIKIGGKEANPVIAKLMDKIGLIPALVIKSAVVMFIGYNAGLNGLIWLQMIIGIYVAVVIWNCVVLRKLIKKEG